MSLYHSSSLNIMLVEDEPAWQIAFQLLLAPYGSLQVSHAVNTGERAWELYQTEKPDVVLLDWHLAGSLNGVALAKRLLEEGHPPSHIILVSGSDTEALENLPIKKISKLQCPKLLAPAVLQLLPLAASA